MNALSWALNEQNVEISRMLIDFDANVSIGDNVKNAIII